MNLYQFMSDSPILSFFLCSMLTWMVVEVFRAVSRMVRK